MHFYAPQTHHIEYSAAHYHQKGNMLQCVKFQTNWLNDFWKSIRKCEKNTNIMKISFLIMQSKFQVAQTATSLLLYVHTTIMP